jgi:hypothetical protein
MVQFNPQRMDYYKRYSEIVADYNREKDRVRLKKLSPNSLTLPRAWTLSGDER